MNRHFPWLLLLLTFQAGGNAAPLLGSECLAAIAARIETGCRNLEEDVSRPNDQPSVRQLTSCALGLLELGEPPDRAEKLMRLTFGFHSRVFQDTPAAPKTFPTKLSL